MKRIFFMSVLVLFFAGIASAQLVNDPFSSYERFMTGDPYYNGPGWDSSNATNFRMYPAGDGTYIRTNEFVPGQIVVYRFTARSNASASITWEDLWDAGDIDTTNFAKRQTNLNATVVDVGGYNFRQITIPLTASNYFVVTNNFGEGPAPVDNLVAVPGTNYVVLQWQYNTLGKQLDVLKGGTNNIWLSTNSGGPYTNIASIPGNLTRYTNTSLTKGKTYYYVVESVDAYNDLYADARLQCRMFPDWFEVSGTPKDKIKVIFKVEAIDVDKVMASEKHIVYMTPVDVDGRFYPFKIPGAFAYATVK